MGALVQKLNGRNWSYEYPYYTVFGAEGAVDGRDWVIDRWSVDPGPCADDIRAIIASDVAAGREDEIAYIGVSPYVGLYLILEGIISLDDLTAPTTTETDDRITVTIELDGTTRQIVIMANATEHRAIATFDKNDRVV